jgi:hypothetical protein
MEDARILSVYSSHEEEEEDRLQVDVEHEVGTGGTLTAAVLG